MQERILVLHVSVAVVLHLYALLLVKLSIKSHSDLVVIKNLSQGNRGSFKFADIHYK